ncbi:MAG: hypothetical protein VW405_03410 [Rhodospirillaceae bacterium]
MIRLPRLLCAFCALATALALAGPAAAQQGTVLPNADPNAPGQVRIQGQTPGAAPAPPPVGGEALLDLREEMRKFIISIARFGRRYRSDFRVLTRGGLDLLVKRDPVEETRVSPARTYMRALDGIVAEGMFFTERRPGTPPPPEIQAPMIDLAEFAARNGLRVLTLDYADGEQFVDKAREEAQKRGFIALVSNRPILDISKLPAYPPRPFDENPNSIASLGQVRNFAVVINSLPYGREDAFALALHGTNHDMVVVDVFHGRKALSRQAVETLKYKKIGAKRLVLARMDVGTAASYSYYWKNGWREGSPPWINAPLRDDPDRYYVEYWQPGWQKIVAGDTNAFLYGVVRQGFDGVLLDGVEAFRFFEGGGEQPEEGQ